MIGLPAHRRFPLKTQPGQVFIDRRLELGPAARGVDVLDAQDEAPAYVARRFRRCQGGQGVAAVQPAAGRRRETGGGAQVR
jgi:hypothetical protein